MDKKRYFYMNAAELMDFVLVLYKKCFWVQIAFSLVISIILTVCFFVIAIAGVIGMSLTFMSGDVPIIPILVLIAIMLLLTAVWFSFTQSGNVIIAKHTLYGDTINLKGTFSRTFKLLPRVLTVVLAQLLIYIPVITILIVVMAVVYFLLFTFDSSVFEMFRYSGLGYAGSNEYYFIILFTFGFVILAYIVFLSISTLINLSIPVAVYERKLFFGAIKKSLSLIKGHFWKILGIRIIWLLIANLLYYNLLLLLYTLSSFLSMATVQFQMGTELLSLLQFVLPLFLQIVMAPLSGILTHMIYFNQKIKKEGLDIELGIEMLRSGRANHE